jgi:hypothetical protein
MVEQNLGEKMYINFQEYLVEYGFFNLRYQKTQGPFLGQDNSQLLHVVIRTTYFLHLQQNYTVFCRNV